MVGILSYCELLTALPGGSQHMRVIRIVRTSVLPFSRAYRGMIEARLDPDQELDTLAGHHDRTYNPNSEEAELERLL